MLTSKLESTYTLFKPETISDVKKLLRLVLSRKIDQARKIIAAHPEVLLIPETVKDYAGRTVTATAFQAALGAEDEEIWHMIEPYFNFLSEGEKIKRQQIKQQFPNAIQSTSTYDFNALVNAITTDTNIKEALQQFREDFQPGHITQGKHFDIRNLIKAYETLNLNYDRWNTIQRSEFWVNVIGFLQRLIPACYANAYCHGFEKSAENSLTACFDHENSFYPLSEDRGLGFDFAIASHGHQTKFKIISYREWEPLEELYKQKNTELLKLLEKTSSQLSQESKPRKHNCVIL